MTGLLPVHVPFWQLSLCVHAFPSLQLVPFEATGFEQAPLVGSHAPGRWQASLAAQVTGFVPVHVPFWQLSLCVHALPSLQLVPFEATGFEHTPVVELHVPATWHASLAAHVIWAAPVQTPDWQVSLWVQAFPSLQGVPSAADAHALLEAVTLVPEGITRVWAARQPLMALPDPIVRAPLGAVIDPGKPRPPPSCTVVPLE